VQGKTGSCQPSDPSGGWVATLFDQVMAPRQDPYSTGVWDGWDANGNPVGSPLGAPTFFRIVADDGTGPITINKPIVGAKIDPYGWWGGENSDFKTVRDKYGFGRYRPLFESNKIDGGTLVFAGGSGFQQFYNDGMWERNKRFDSDGRPWFWTSAVSDADATTNPSRYHHWALWWADIPSNGWYDIRVRIPFAAKTSELTDMTYRVMHTVEPNGGNEAGKVVPVVASLTAKAQQDALAVTQPKMEAAWVLLAKMYFEAGGPAVVM